MLSRTLSAAVLGIDAYLVDVEVHLEGMTPYFNIVGLPDGAVRESRQRVEAAIKNSGINFPIKKIVVNLAPANIKKEGSSLDLPIALGILSAAGFMRTDRLSDSVLLGELSLDGNLRGVQGVLPVAMATRDCGKKRLVLPYQNAREAALVTDLDVYPAHSLLEAMAFLNGKDNLTPFKFDIANAFKESQAYPFDFVDVMGQHHVKRALEVTAAGGHNLLLMGPPGSGKTMLAKRLPTILPDLTIEESLETTKIHSVAGHLPPQMALIADRPFRSPHHTISDSGLIGGGTIPHPGEVSLAHHGVLFLDELPEFKKNALEVLRQPMEEGQVTISRSMATVTYPANFMLAAAMNPCPCGYLTDAKHECTCNLPMIQRYRSRVSGPLLDRIDIHVEVPALDYKGLANPEPGETSRQIRARVKDARRIQTHRFARRRNLFCNAHMRSADTSHFCKIDEESAALLEAAMSRLGLSARAYHRILKVARTIADLEASPAIRSIHVSEAIQYRSLDRI